MTVLRKFVFNGVDRLPAGLTERVDSLIQRAQGRLLPNRLHGRVDLQVDQPVPAHLLIATSTGLLRFDKATCVRLLDGFFFGLTLHEDRWYAFRKVSGRSGQIISFRLGDSGVFDLRSEVAGLSPGIHQIDAFAGRLYVTDTTNNRLLIYDLHRQNWRRPEQHYPAGPSSGRKDPRYVHVNSVFVTQERIYLVYHNQSRVTGRPSELAVLDRHCRPLERIALNARCAHNMAIWEGKPLICNSLDGTLAVGDQVLSLDAFSRGIALFEHTCIVGGSPFAARVDRDQGDSSLFYCDLRVPRVIAQIVLKRVGSVYEVRSISPVDHSLSENTRTRPLPPISIGTQAV